jgi:hypothetical protein
MIRTFEQAIIEQFAAHSRVPVVNGLTNEYHPCQILGDIYTFIEQRGDIAGRTVAWIGDSNNVCNYLAPGRRRCWTFNVPRVPLRRLRSGARSAPGFTAPSTTRSSKIRWKR